MGAQLSGGGGVRRGRKRRGPMSEINVTPFVDVMLVLLIVFMVTAPLLTVGIQVDLPSSQAPNIQGTDEPLTVSIDADGLVYIQDTQVTQADLVPQLRAIAGTASDRRIFVRGDRAINYGQVVEVMGVINQAGFKRVALIAQSPVATR